MKTTLGFLVLALSFSALAQQNLPANQCPTPNVLLAKDYIGLASENVGQSFSRQGTNAIPTTSEFAGQLKARIFKVYEERYCVTKTYSYAQQVCADVQPEIALGRGNEIYRSFYDLNITLLKRADMFSRTVRYGISTNQAARLNTANELVKHLTRLASTTGIANTWESFGATVKQIVAEGFLTQAEFDDIITINADANRRALGFMPLAGVQYNEGKGNGKLGRLFDLSLPIARRAGLIRATLTGVNDAASHALAQSFINFASVNGVPANWNQFVLLMRDAVVKNAISQIEFNKVTVDLEIQNRINLGFEINYFVCKMENRVHYFNAVDVTRKNEFNSEVSKNFRINVSNAPLLAGESESVDVSFHGLNGLTVSPTQSYNGFTVQTSADADVAIYTLVGARRRVNAPNTILAKVLHQGNKINVNLQNTAFNPLIGGKVVVDVHFYEKVVILKDKDLGLKTFELLDGNMNMFSPNVKMIKASRPAYVEVTMKVIGSPYYNESSSSMKEFKE